MGEGLTSAQVFNLVFGYALFWGVVGIARNPTRYELLFYVLTVGAGSLYIIHQIETRGPRSQP